MLRPIYRRLNSPLHRSSTLTTTTITPNAHHQTSLSTSLTHLQSNHRTTISRSFSSYQQPYPSLPPKIAAAEITLSPKISQFHHNQLSTFIDKFNSESTGLKPRDILSTVASKHIEGRNGGALGEILSKAYVVKEFAGLLDDQVEELLKLTSDERNEDKYSINSRSEKTVSLISSTLTYLTKELSPSKSSLQSPTLSEIAVLQSTLLTLTLTLQPIMIKISTYLHPTSPPLHLSKHSQTNRKIVKQCVSGLDPTQLGVCSDYSITPVIDLYKNFTDVMFKSNSLIARLNNDVSCKGWGTQSEPPTATKLPKQGSTNTWEVKYTSPVCLPIDFMARNVSLCQVIRMCCVLSNEVLKQRLLKTNPTNPSNADVFKSLDYELNAHLIKIDALQYDLEHLSTHSEGGVGFMNWYNGRLSEFYGVDDYDGWDDYGSITRVIVNADGEEVSDDEFDNEELDVVDDEVEKEEEEEIEVVAVKETLEPAKPTKKEDSKFYDYDHSLYDSDNSAYVNTTSYSQFIGAGLSLGRLKHKHSKNKKGSSSMNNSPTLTAPAWKSAYTVTGRRDITNDLIDMLALERLNNQIAKEAANRSRLLRLDVVNREKRMDGIDVVTGIITDLPDEEEVGESSVLESSEGEKQQTKRSKTRRSRIYKNGKLTSSRRRRSSALASKPQIPPLSFSELMETRLTFAENFDGNRLGIDLSLDYDEDYEIGMGDDDEHDIGSGSRNGTGIGRVSEEQMIREEVILDGMARILGGETLDFSANGEFGRSEEDFDDDDFDEDLIDDEDDEDEDEDGDDAIDDYDDFKSSVKHNNNNNNSNRTNFQAIVVDVPSEDSDAAVNDEEFPEENFDEEWDDDDDNDGSNSGKKF